MQESEEVGHDAFDLIGHKHLVAVELYLVALEFYIALDAWEIENTRKMEWVIYIQMNPEEGLIVHGIERAIELLVVLVLQLAWGSGPERLHVVDDIVLGSLHLLAVLPLGLLAKGYGHSQELAVFVEQRLDAGLLQEFLAVVVDVEDDVRTTVFLLCFFQCI